MTLVVDASVAVKFIVREVGTDAARALLAGPELLIAPDLLLIEAANTLWKKVEQAEVSTDHAQRHLDALPLFFAQLHSAQALVTDAMTWSLRLAHPVYDCVYLALALRENAKLVTADRRFLAAVKETELAGRMVALGGADS